MANVYDIIIRPIITERSMAAVADKKYVFEVAKDAGKIEIKNAVEADLRRQGRQGQHDQRFTARPSAWARAVPATTRSWKKAYVQLTADSKTIEMFEGMV